MTQPGAPIDLSLHLHYKYPVTYEGEWMRTELLQLRLRPDEKQAFQEAAPLAGISLSAWARERLRTAAIRQLERTGRPVPFVASIPLRSVRNG